MLLLLLRKTNLKIYQKQSNSVERPKAKSPRLRTWQSVEAMVGGEVAVVVADGVEAEQAEEEAVVVAAVVAEAMKTAVNDQLKVLVTPAIQSAGYC
mmetsp:Transcript_19580/g.26835  ORF Transcript_19580/g.26835 Transcript_19580/m.26835 type:complete len:96 (-) Transcript_19580:2642-2929(-)